MFDVPAGRKTRLWVCNVINLEKYYNVDSKRKMPVTRFTLAPNRKSTIDSVLPELYPKLGYCVNVSCCRIFTCVVPYV